MRLTDDELTQLICLVKSGRVEYTSMAPLLKKLEDERDCREYGEPLVKRNEWVGGPIVEIIGSGW